MSAQQQNFAFAPVEHKSNADFFIGAFNQEAYTEILSSSHLQICMVGAQGAGKTHLAHIYAQQQGGVLIHPPQLDEMLDRPPHRLIIDDCDQLPMQAQESLLHLINLQKEQGGQLILVARLAPTRWPVSLPDLASRLQAFQMLRILEPDDQAIRVILVKLFHDRQLGVDPDLIDYLVPRMERSFASAQKMVEQLDSYSLANKANITVKFAQKTLFNR